MRRARDRLYLNQSDVTPYIRPLENNPLKAKGYCLICGRKLQSEESKQRGYGKLCYLKALRKRCLF